MKKLWHVIKNLKHIQGLYLRPNLFSVALVKTVFSETVPLNILFYMGYQAVRQIYALDYYKKRWNFWKKN